MQDLIIDILMPVRQVGDPCNPCNFDGLFRNNQDNISWEVVAKVTAKSLNEVWNEMQHIDDMCGELMNIRSLSVGDILHVTNTNQYFMVKSMGFKEITLKSNAMQLN